MPVVGGRGQRLDPNDWISQKESEFLRSKIVENIDEIINFNQAEGIYTTTGIAPTTTVSLVALRPLINKTVVDKARLICTAYTSTGTVNVALYRYDPKTKKITLVAGSDVTLSVTATGIVEKSLPMQITIPRGTRLFMGAYKVSGTFSLVCLGGGEDTVKKLSVPSYGPSYNIDSLSKLGYLVVPAVTYLSKDMSNMV